MLLWGARWSAEGELCQVTKKGMSPGQAAGQTPAQPLPSGCPPLKGAHEPPTHTEAGEKTVWPCTRLALGSTDRPLWPSRRNPQGGRDAHSQSQSLQAWPGSNGEKEVQI